MWACIKISSASALFTLTRSDLPPSGGSTLPHIDLLHTCPLNRPRRRYSQFCSSYRLPLYPLCNLPGGADSPTLNARLASSRLQPVNHSDPHSREPDRGLSLKSHQFPSRAPSNQSPSFVTSADPSLRLQFALPTMLTSSQLRLWGLPWTFSRELPLALCWDGREEREHQRGLPKSLDAPSKPLGCPRADTPPHTRLS